jgi:DnaK suppressor protein
VAKLSPKKVDKLKKVMIERIATMFRETRGDIRDTSAQAHNVTSDNDESPRDEGDEALRIQLADLRLSLDEREARLAQLMEEALGRMADGSYGECIDCGGEIEFERLKTIPWALRCRDDQEAFEQSMQQHPPTM